jgi:hypothetical protein
VDEDISSEYPLYLRPSESFKITITFIIDDSEDIKNHEFYALIKYQEDGGVRGWSDEQYKSPVEKENH